MFEFFFDNGIVFIAIAIFIGRLILQFRRRGGEEGKKPPSPISGFFGDEEEAGNEPEERSGRASYSRTRGSSDFLREIVMREEAAAPRPPVSVQPSVLVRPPVVEQPVRRHEEAPRGSEAGGFLSSLNRLSPLKRAVVFAEILGPPKGL
jgi:hypothetical protein